MSTKLAKTEPKVPVLKGQEAEDKVFEYVKRMNRPYGAVDVSANLKGAVPKTATQKILVSLAEKGKLVQKLYGKTSFFVVNQDKIESLSPEKMASLETEQKEIEESNKLHTAEVKALTSELNRTRASPNDQDLENQTAEIDITIEKTLASLEPLRAGAPAISVKDLEMLDAEWMKWRAEWVRRRKIYKTLWGYATDASTPAEAEILVEELGIENDTPEHDQLERSNLCSQNNSLKRKR